MRAEWWRWHCPGADDRQRFSMGTTSNTTRTRAQPDAYIISIANIMDISITNIVKVRARIVVILRCGSLACHLRTSSCWTPCPRGQQPVWQFNSRAHHPYQAYAQVVYAGTLRMMQRWNWWRQSNFSHAN